MKTVLSSREILKILHHVRPPLDWLCKGTIKAEIEYGGYELTFNATQGWLLAVYSPDDELISTVDKELEAEELGSQLLFEMCVDKNLFGVNENA